MAEEEPRLDAPDRSAKPAESLNVDLPPVIKSEEEAPLVPQNKAGETRYGKITVVGDQQVTRGGIASIVEKLRVGLNKLTGQNRELKTPIIIRLYGQEGDTQFDKSIVAKIDQIQGEYQLMLHIHLARGVDNTKLRYHAMKLLLIERGLSDGQQLAEGDRFMVQPWLVLGVLEALDIKAGRADKSVYQANLPYFDILALDKVLAADESNWYEMEGRQPIAFRAISGALVNALLRQPQGRPSMAGYLAAVPTYKGEMENLMRKHFPSMNRSQNSLTKWVDLEMAELGTAQMSDVYSILETEKRLQSILILRYRDEEKQAVEVGLDEYKKVLELEPEERFEAVAGARAELERLSYRCFPVYRPLLAEYEVILREVITGEDKNIPTRLQSIANTRQEFIKAGGRVRDYLDWFYITRSTEVSGDFKSYMDLSEALEKETSQPKKDDAIQNYLDKVEELFMGSSRK